MASATPPVTSISSISAGEGLVIDSESSGTIEASLRLRVGDALHIVLDLTGYPEQAPTWSSTGNQMLELPASDVTAFSNVEAIRSGSGPRLLLQHLLHYLRLYFRPDYGAALASRIEALAQLLRSEADGEELSAWSVAHLIGFLEKNHPLSQPKLAAGPNGEIIAFWRSNGADFSARFLPSGSVRFLVTVPSPSHPDGVSRSSGDTTLSELFARAGLADLQWMREVV